jgi:hypothetical protein
MEEAIPSWFFLCIGIYFIKYWITNMLITYIDQFTCVILKESKKCFVVRSRGLVMHGCMWSILSLIQVVNIDVLHEFYWLISHYMVSIKYLIILFQTLLLSCDVCMNVLGSKNCLGIIMYAYVTCHFFFHS